MPDLYEFLNTNTIALMGHGYTDNMDNFNVATEAAATITYSCSVFDFANAMLGCPLRVVLNRSTATATSKQILDNQLQHAVNAKVAYALLFGVLHDVTNGVAVGDRNTPDTIIYNLHTIIRTLNNNGTKVILGFEMARASWTDAQAKAAASVFAYFVQNRRDYRGLYLFSMTDIGISIASEANTQTGVPDSAFYMTQGGVLINPNTRSSRLAAPRLVEAFKQAGVLPRVMNMYVGSDGNTNGDNKIRTRNQFLLGTDGYRDPGSVIQGSMPTSYTCVRESANTTLTAITSVLTRQEAGVMCPIFSDGAKGNVSKIAIVSNASALSTENIVSNAETPETGGVLSVGTRLVVEAEISVIVTQGSLQRLNLRCCQKSNNAPIARAFEPFFADSSDEWNLTGTLDNPGVFSGVIQTREFPTLVSAVHYAQLRIGLAASSVAAVYFGRMWLRQVN